MYFKTIKNKVIKNSQNPLSFALLALTLLFFLFSLPLRANEQYRGLDEKINLSLKKTDAAALVLALSKQSSYSFSYSQPQLAAVGIENAEFKNLSLAAVLKQLEEQYGLQFSVFDKTIAVKAGKKHSKTSTQQQNGTISGKVLDDKGEPLPGASLKVTETGSFAKSNTDGTYQLKLSPGKYSLEISFLSFQSKKITDIDVEAGKNTSLTIVLKASTNSLNTVTVTSSYRKANVEGLYARQKNSINITDGISADLIARTPDKNIGEVLKRIPGVATVENKYVVVRGLGERYNGSLLNGQTLPSTEINRKQFSFDIIPSAMVDNVTVYKTLTADKSAEFGGALVEVNTKSIPDEDFFTINIGSSVNSKTTGKDFRFFKIEDIDYLAGISNSRKLFGLSNWKSNQDILNKYFGPYPDYKISNKNSLENNWQLHNYTPGPVYNFQVTAGKNILLKQQDRLGIIASLSYRNNMETQDVRMSRLGWFDNKDGETVGFIGKRYGFTTNIAGLLNVGYTHKNSTYSFQTLYLRSLDRSLTMGSGNQDRYNPGVGAYESNSNTFMWQNQLKGEHKLSASGVKLNWMLSSINLDRQKPDNHQFIGTPLNQGKDNPTENVDFSISDNLGSELSDGALRFWTSTREKNYNWQADVSAPFLLSIGNIDINSTLKTGYSGWYKDRSFWVLNIGTQKLGSGNFIPLSEYLQPSDKQNIYATKFGDNYQAVARLHAGYVMMDQKIAQKWRLVWGLRGEYYNINAVNARIHKLFSQYSQNFDFSEILNREPNMRYFPSAALTYSLSPTMNFRFSYSKSLIRPDLREISYFKEYDFELGGGYGGNTPIRSSVLDNWDFRYEWYPEPGEVISLSLFQKNIAYPMEIYKEGDNREFLLKNNKSAINKGIELDVRKSLAFTNLPVLKDLTLFGNFTYMDAYVTPMNLNIGAEDLKIVAKELIKEKEHRPQAGASNFMYNAGMYYQHKKFSINASYNYVSNRMFRPADTYSNSLFERPLESLDAQVAVPLLKNKMQVKLNVSNLLGSKSIIYQNVYPNGAVLKPSTSELLYQKGDLIDFEATPGRTYSLSLTYNFK